MLGTEEDLHTLCEQAHQLGMRVILDGVFNHTGSQSVYFNVDGFYPSLARPRARNLLILAGTPFIPGPTITIPGGDPHPAGSPGGLSRLCGLHRLNP